MDLTGKTILVTRAAHQAEEFARAIERYGGTPILFPTIDVQPPKSWEECDRAIDGISRYDGFLFASANAVSFFL